MENAKKTNKRFSAIESDLIFNYLGLAKTVELDSETCENEEQALSILSQLLDCSKEDIQAEWQYRL